MVTMPMKVRGFCSDPASWGGEYSTLESEGEGTCREESETAFQKGDITRPRGLYLAPCCFPSATQFAVKLTPQPSSTLRQFLASQVAHLDKSRLKGLMSEMSLIDMADMIPGAWYHQKPELVSKGIGMWYGQSSPSISANAERG
ncbi:hypothetical protein NM208_g12646 [Fusarium decemcellulare]|uniref:Uncharacterized protein n=1 Tax=Fusarium decemcellulare TaxID=57161 RepID=A0ACC1RP74_9HYPO|nr:hypothetical protein NM208_g12646 [Fusarium decemcellulare]